MSEAGARSIQLIVGLGNPGSRYADTRHNVGFVVVDELARRFGVQLKDEARFGGKWARVQIGERYVYLLQPQTYMNLSGQSVRKLCQYYKIPVESIVVVCDDVAIPFGEVRVRAQGSAGGHNGLRSVQQELGSSAYARVKVGVGERRHGSLESHVLGRFTAEEQAGLGEVLVKSVEVCELLLREPIARVMTAINQRPNNKKSADTGAEAAKESREQKQNAQDHGQESKNEAST